MKRSHLARAVLAIALTAILAACADPAPLPATVDAPPPPMATADTAPASDSADVHRFTIGSLDAAVLRDGDIRVPNDGKTLAVGIPKPEVDAVLAQAGEPTDTVHLAVQALLVRSGDRVLLFDTGAGNADFADAGRLPASLRAAGVEPAQVTDIFISHAHPDHVGGLTDGAGQALFANATVHLSAPEWQAVQAGPANAALVAAISPRVDAFAPGAEVVPGVTAIPVEGHTPGHSAYEIVDGDARLLYIGDAAHHFAVSVQRPQWTIAFDGDAPVAEASREALLARVADNAETIASPHFPYPGLGRIVRRDGGFAWAPLQ
ncbi:MBL fold metallo-hydrolase [Luteimonas sp. 9C]|uniref:MBL fold metallo-hydrolase n=1 Tax=Luteimonas sp. 9C TaxID=2653148 RepID=UPI0012F354EA|nr:MBL fold metallo-hydrolase [Luteimonas sp. 9C]VXB05402.1 MBL fold metallo-hydrolase [Luteimonas sp. 9C]